MKKINIDPPNIYSCMNCSKEFESKVDLLLFWFCSKSCQYKFAFLIVDSSFPSASKKKKNALTKKLCEVTIK